MEIFEQMAWLPLSACIVLGMGMVQGSPWHQQIAEIFKSSRNTPVNYCARLIYWPEAAEGACHCNGFILDTSHSYFSFHHIHHSHFHLLHFVIWIFSSCSESGQEYNNTTVINDRVNQEFMDIQIIQCCIGTLAKYNELGEGEGGYVCMYKLLNNGICMLSIYWLL